MSTLHVKARNKHAQACAGEETVQILPMSERKCMSVKRMWDAAA